MRVKHALSVNIQRDAERELPYFPTPNARRAADLIAADFRAGIRCSTLIGSYGTGKSSFLWAFGQSLAGGKRFFEVNLTEEKQPAKVEILNLVGEFSSATRFFARTFGLDETTDPEPEFIFAEIYNRYRAVGKKNAVLVILVDEFGKFLEFAARTQPERELYFLQQLAEFVQNPAYNILLVTTLHQNFDAYALGLTQAQRQEWSKVKGRFREITFNEPVEQLLFLAAEQLGARPEILTDDTQNHLKTLAELFAGSKSFGAESGFVAQIVPKLFPLDPFAASVVTLALQRYGQNERSLFSFLESADHTGVNRFSDRRLGRFYHLAYVYDYLIFNFYALLQSQYNPDFNAWAGMKRALERVENAFENPETSQKAAQIVKSIGLLNLFASQGARLDKDFLEKYLRVCLDLKSSEIIGLLVEKRILIFREYSQRFVLSDGTDKDIKAELLHAGDQIGEITDVPTLLGRSFDFPPVFAKEYFYKTGTPRVFKFEISQEPKTTLIPRGDTDGFINLIFNDRLGVNELCKISKQQEEAVMYAFYQNSRTIKNLLFDIEKAKKAIENVKDDHVAKQEFQNILRSNQSLLHHYIFDNLFSRKGDVVWVFQGDIIKVESKREFNDLLNIVCDEIYPATPHFKNELVNRSKLSSQIFLAKKNFLGQLAGHWGEDDLGFEKSKFPPEKTIYLTLLKANGLVPDPSNPEKPFGTDGLHPSFLPLWDFCKNWLDTAKTGRRRVSDLTNALAARPFKLKQGFIDFWVPTFLFLHREDFALFTEKGYIPALSGDVLELIVRKPLDFEIKTFDVAGVRLDIFNSYRQLVQLGDGGKISNQTFVETIRPFLTFYRQLPEYARKTRRLSREAIAVREAISKATDPERTFFSDLPAALGVTLAQLQTSPEALSDYADRMQNAIRELRGCFDELVNRFENFIRQEICADETLDFQGYRQNLRERFGGLKTHLLLANQKTFAQRLQSELDDRKGWLVSVGQEVLEKPMHKIGDEDEPLLYQKFESLVSHLDASTQLSLSSFDEINDEVFSISFEKGVEKRGGVFKYTKDSKQEIEVLEKQIVSQLGNEKRENLAALASIAFELLEN